MRLLVTIRVAGELLDYDTRSRTADRGADYRCFRLPGYGSTDNDL